MEETMNSIEYAKLLKTYYGEERHFLPMWEVKTKDLTYVLAWTDQGHEVFWFEDSSMTSSDPLYKKIHQIENSEDALYWFLGNIEWSGLNHEGEHAIKKVTRLGSLHPFKDEVEKNQVVFPH